MRPIFSYALGRSVNLKLRLARASAFAIIVLATGTILPTVLRTSPQTTATALCWVCDILRQPCAPGVIVYQCSPASPEDGSIVCCGNVGCNIVVVAVCNSSSDYAYCEFCNECTGFNVYNTYNCTQCR